MSDQTEREARYAEAIRARRESAGRFIVQDLGLAGAVIALADQEQDDLRAALQRSHWAEAQAWAIAESAQARVRELEDALQQSRDDHQGAVEKLRAEVRRRTAESEALAEALNEEQSRAEVAEARLRAVEALAHEWERQGWDVPEMIVDIRAALASPVESDAAVHLLRVTEESLAAWFGTNLTLERFEGLADDEWAASLIDHFANPVPVEPDAEAAS